MPQRGCLPPGGFPHFGALRTGLAPFSFAPAGLEVPGLLPPKVRSPRPRKDRAAPWGETTTGYYALWELSRLFSVELLTPGPLTLRPSPASLLLRHNPLRFPLLGVGLLTILCFLCLAPRPRTLKIDCFALGGFRHSGVPTVTCQTTSGAATQRLGRLGD